MSDYIIKTKVELDYNSLNKTINELDKKLKNVDEVKLQTSFDNSTQSMQQMKSSAAALGAGFISISKNMKEISNIKMPKFDFSSGVKELYTPFQHLSALVADITLSVRELVQILAVTHRIPLNDEFMRLHNTIQQCGAEVYKLEQALVKNPQNDGLKQALEQRKTDLKQLQQQINFLEGARQYKGSESAIYGTVQEILNTDVEGAAKGIENSFKGIGNAAEKSTSKTKGFGSSLASLVKTFLGLKAGQKIFEGLADSIKSASDIAEAKNIADVMFGENKLNGFVDELGQKFNLAQEQGYKFTGTMASMLKSMDVPAQQMSKMSENLSKLSGDISSFYNINGDVAFSKLRSGMSGMTMAMKQLGINMNIAQLDAFLLSKGFNVQYKNLDSASKELVRYNYIIEKTRHIQGDFARTSGTWANQVRTLSLEWQKFKQIIGAGLIAALTPLLRLINGLLAGLNKIGAALAKTFNLNITNPTGQSGGMVEEMDDIGDAAETNQEKVKKFEKQLMGFDKINNLTTPNKDSGVGNKGNQKINMPLADYNKVNKPLREMYDLLDKIKPLLDSFKKGFKTGFGDGAEIFKDLIKHSKELKKVLGQIFDKKTTQAFNQMLKDISFSFGEILGACTRIALVIADSIVNGALQALKERVELLRTTFRNVFKDIGDIWKSQGDMFKNLADIIEQQRPIFTQLFKGIFGVAIDVLSTVGRVLIGTWSEIMKGIAGIIRDNKDGISKALSSILQPLVQLWDDFSQVTKEAATKIGETFDKYLRPIVQGFFDFCSKVIGGFLEGWNSVGETIKHILPVDDLKKIINEIFDSEVWEGIKNTLTSAFELLAPIFSTVAQIIGVVVKSGFLDYVQSVANVLKSLFGIVSGVFGVITGLIKIVVGLFKWVGSGFKDTSTMISGFKSVFNGFGKILETLFGNIANNVKKVTSWFGNILTGLGGVFGKFSEGLGKVFTGIGNFFLKDIPKWISKLGDFIKGIGTTIGNGIWDGIKWVFNKIGGFFESIGDFVGGLFGKSSHGSGGSIPKLASGGIATRSTIANIGEAGREAVLPLNNSTLGALAKMITSNMSPQYAMAGGTPNVIINSNFDADKFLDYSVHTTNRRNSARGVL